MTQVWVHLSSFRTPGQEVNLRHWWRSLVPCFGCTLMVSNTVMVYNSLTCVHLYLHITVLINTRAYYLKKVGRVYTVAQELFSTFYLRYKMFFFIFLQSAKPLRALIQYRRAALWDIEFLHPQSWIWSQQTYSGECECYVWKKSPSLSLCVHT